MLRPLFWLIANLAVTAWNIANGYWFLTPVSIGGAVSCLFWLEDESC